MWLYNSGLSQDVGVQLAKTVTHSTPSPTTYPTKPLTLTGPLSFSIQLLHQRETTGAQYYTVKVCVCVCVWVEGGGARESIETQE